MLIFFKRNGVIEIIKCLEGSSLLIKGVTETVENDQITKRRDFRYVSNTLSTT